MHIIKDIKKLPELLKGGVIAIGNFDGVHRGHQEILQRALKWAKHHNVPAMALTLEPHPQQYFATQEKKDFRLTDAQTKAHLIEGFGMTGLIELPFDQKMAELSAFDFVQGILKEQCALIHCVVGYDFHFGHNRQGNGRFLMDNGVETTVVSQQVDDNGAPYASRTIRKVLKQGNFDEAFGLLGHPYTLRGRVIHGDKKGRTIGFPTANLDVAREVLIPHYGVYAVKVVAKGRQFDGVMNIGIRPTMASNELRLEVYLFDFQGDLYGENLSVDLYSFMRPELRFDSLEHLKKQIERDCHKARHYFKRRSQVKHSLKNEAFSLDIKCEE